MPCSRPLCERRKFLHDNMVEIPNRILFSEMKHVTVSPVCPHTPNPAPPPRGFFMINSANSPWQNGSPPALCARLLEPTLYSHLFLALNSLQYNLNLPTSGFLASSWFSSHCHSDLLGGAKSCCHSVLCSAELWLKGARLWHFPNFKCDTALRHSGC